MPQQIKLAQRFLRNEKKQRALRFNFTCENFRRKFRLRSKGNHTRRGDSLLRQKPSRSVKVNCRAIRPPLGRERVANRGEQLQTVTRDGLHV